MSKEMAFPAVSCAATIVALCPWFALIVPARSPGESVGDGDEGESLPHPPIVMVTPARIVSAASNVNSRLLKDFSLDISSSMRRMTIR